MSVIMDNETTNQTASQQTTDKPRAKRSSKKKITPNVIPPEVYQVDQYKFWKVLTENLATQTQALSKLIERPGKPATEQETHNEFIEYSKAYQNFAQKNVSIIEKFNITVPIKDLDKYNSKLQELLNRNKTNKRNK